MESEAGFDPPRGRWRFLDESAPDEQAFRGRALEAMAAFWRAFAANASGIDQYFCGNRELDLPAFMHEHLGAVHPELMWEYGRALRGTGHRLVITPESATHLRPLLATLLGRAPAVPGWEFYPYRVAEDAEMAEHTVQGRTGGSLEGVRVRVEPTASGLIDLMFVSARATRDHDQAERDAYVATETLLGEDILDRWIGRIGAEGLPAKKRALLRWFGPSKGEPDTTLGLDELKPAVDRAIHVYRAGLNEKAHHQWVGEASWSLLEIKPEQAEDYPEQTDLFVAKTPHLNLWQAAHGGASFYNERFSRVGETFCYVKLDGSQGLDDEKFEDKGEIEDAIDEVLAPNAWGCQIGGGTGLRYSYIDLALTDLEQGLTAVRERLRAGNVPRRSWIQFFASDMKREWLGVYPDSPQPPQLQ